MSRPADEGPASPARPPGGVLAFDPAPWARSMALPGNPGDVAEEAAWRARIDAAPALVYLLARHRQDAYAIGSATDRGAIAYVRAQTMAAQPPGARQWPALVWLQTMPSRERAEHRVRRLRRWPHAWLRHLVERANPGWTDLDDLLFHRPPEVRRPLPESASPPVDAADAARHAAAEADVARRAIAALPTRADLAGGDAAWWYAQVKAAPWLVSVFACSRRHACRIEAAPGRVLEPTCARLFGYNRPRALAGRGLPPWRWVWLEPHLDEAGAQARVRGLQRMPQPWIARLVSGDNPHWHALEALMAGCHPDELEAARVPMR